MILLGVVAVVLVAVTVHDLVQRKHAILRNFPVIGHLRFLLEAIGPELRQYIVTDNDSERPFSRDERRWVYATSKSENSYFGFGTDNDLDRVDDYVIFKQVTFPFTPASPAPDHPDPNRPLESLKVLGGPHRRPLAFRPSSIVNVSGMSFGSLSGAAVAALNRGCAMAGALQATGEGGVSEHHRQGGELVWQIGTGYFGCRDAEGRFDLARLVDTVASAPVRAIEIKLSQGAKPGLGGMLPGRNVTPTIAAARGVPVGIDCHSPARHSAFDDVDGMIGFIETIAAATGLPVGIKSAVGDEGFWVELVDRMSVTGAGPDFVTIDGGEGGTGAAPLAFADHVALPFRWGFARVFSIFAERDMTDRVTFIGSGKLGLPHRGLTALALGCDMLNVGRSALFSIGCIQAQRCHTDRCPTGVATQNPRLERGLDVGLKSQRCANYLAAMRFELVRLAHAMGVEHPSLVPADRIEVLEDGWRSRSLPEVVGFRPHWGVPSSEVLAAWRMDTGGAAGPPVGLR